MVSGYGVGRTIGFKTANIEIEDFLNSCSASVEGGSSHRNSITHYGFNPESVDFLEGNFACSINGISKPNILLE